MLPSVLLALTAVIGSTAASPQWGPWGNPQIEECLKQKCLNQTQVNQVINDYSSILQYPAAANVSTIANARLSDTFVVYSDSILSLKNISQPAGSPPVVLGTPAFPNKQALIAASPSTPPLPNLINQGNFSSCDKISWRWVTKSLGPYEVQGIIDFDVNVTTTQINAVYSEFNSLAFAQNIQIAMAAAAGH